MTLSTGTVSFANVRAADEAAETERDCAREEAHRLLHAGARARPFRAGDLFQSHELPANYVTREVYGLSCTHNENMKSLLSLVFSSHWRSPSAAVSWPRAAARTAAAPAHAALQVSFDARARAARRPIPRGRPADCLPA